MADKRGRRELSAPDLNDFGPELRAAGDRPNLVARIEKLRAALEGFAHEDRKLIEIGRAAKKNYAQALSEAIALKTANALRSDFPEIFPTADGKGHESRTAGAGGLKKIDVNYSTREHGLGLAISIKTINFKDDGTGRYTKNAKRVDGELRAEAQDVHERQRYAVLVAYLFLPHDAATDGQHSFSSLRHIAEILSHRSGRVRTTEDDSKIELAFIGLYRDSGEIAFFEPERVPPTGIPEHVLTFAQTLDRVRQAYLDRNPRSRRSPR